MQSSFRQFTHMSCRVTFFYSMRWCYVEQSTHAVNFIFSKAYEQTWMRIYFSEYLCLFSKVLINCKIAVGHWKRIYYLKPWKLENTPSKRGNVVTTCAPAHSNQTESMRNVDKVWLMEMLECVKAGQCYRTSIRLEFFVNNCFKYRVVSCCKTVSTSKCQLFKALDSFG